jgi:hypothetical protein
MLALLPKKRGRSKGVPKDAAKSPADVDGERIKKIKSPGTHFVGERGVRASQFLRR